MNEVEKTESKIQKCIRRLKDLAFITGQQLRDISDNSSDEDILELEKYISATTFDKEPLTLNKIKVLIHLMNKNKIFDKEGADKIIAFINHYDYGWKNGYITSNHCLRDSKNHCRKPTRIQTEEDIQDSFVAVWEIFQHEKYGSITLFLFNYCLAALLNSLLGHDNLHLPFYLQIACERNTGLYSLIREILIICDVNSGLVEYCRDPFHHYGSCNYQCIHYYPTQFTEKDLCSLAYNRDVPVLIDGYENERYYHTLLREIANIPNRRQPLETQDRFDLYPIFM